MPSLSASGGFLLRGCRRPVQQQGRLFATYLSSHYDLFRKLKEEAGGPKTGTAEDKRKPAQHVVALAEKILSLNLLEAADLCDLCQTALRTRGEHNPPTNRMPFPHPGGFFAGGAMMAAGFVQPGMVAAPPAAAAGAAAAAPAAAAAAAPAATAASAAASPAPSSGATRMNVIIESFEPAKKIMVIKEARALLKLGIREAKDLVEAAPKLLASALDKEEAEALAAKLRAAGSTIRLDPVEG